MSKRNRALVGLVAMIAWTGLILQASVSFPGMLAKGLTFSDAFIRFFSYFTVLTNTFIAVDCLICFVKPEGRWSKSAKGRAPVDPANVFSCSQKLRLICA